MKKGMIGVLSAIGGAAAGVAVVGKGVNDRVAEKQKMSDKHLALFLMMNQWVKVKQAGKKLTDYFEQQGYHEIAIYGMSFVGETLMEELRGSNIKVKYGIDQRADKICVDLDVVTPDETLDEVDAIVVTSNYFFKEIEEKLLLLVDCPILNFEDILYEI